MTPLKLPLSAHKASIHHPANDCHRIAHELEKHSAGLAPLNHELFDDAIDIVYDFAILQDERDAATVALTAAQAELKEADSHDKRVREIAERIRIVPLDHTSSVVERAVQKLVQVSDAAMERIKILDGELTEGDRIMDEIESERDASQERVKFLEAEIRQYPLTKSMIEDIGGDRESATQKLVQVSDADAAECEFTKDKMARQIIDLDSALTAAQERADKAEADKKDWEEHCGKWTRKADSTADNLRAATAALQAMGCKLVEGVWVKPCLDDHNDEERCINRFKTGVSCHGTGWLPITPPAPVTESAGGK